MLEEAVRPVQVVVKRCSCGGQIMAPDLGPMIDAAVTVHRKTWLHLRWREKVGWRIRPMRFNGRRG